MSHPFGRFCLLVILFLIPAIAWAQPSEPLPIPIDPAVTAELARSDEATFWIVMSERADLSTAVYITDWAARGAFVVSQLQETAVASQQPIQAILEEQEVSYQSFWITNALLVTGNSQTINALKGQSGIAAIKATGVFQLPSPIIPPNARTASLTSNHPSAVEWNIERINAPQVWSTFGARGEGIVIANIDTGVEVTHPALAKQYRGYQANGNLTHDYNWFDPSNICGSPSLQPCDTDGHGTHTMGTMVGETAVYQIGVAPRAQWIAAKGCETHGCAYDALIASGQWMLAPTDLNGENPRPDLRPHIINNSWGGGGGNNFYLDIVDAWVAAGIFPVFAVGNMGPSCETAGSPADYTAAYAVGAFNGENTLASFSSRGPAFLDDGTKPNVSAPGQNVFSSVPDGYRTYDGTSMAAPHVSGAVALLWSAAPILVGDIDATRALLDNTAVDVNDTSCGGTPGNNNAWGEGRLDVFAAVSQAPKFPVGQLTGTVRNVDGEPIAGATIRVEGDFPRAGVTNSRGEFTLQLPSGTYTPQVTAFGYAPALFGPVTVVPNEATALNIELEVGEHYPLSGQVVTDLGIPQPNVPVFLVDTPLAPQITDADGYFSFSMVPPGTYLLMAEANSCQEGGQSSVTLSAEHVVTMTVTAVRDAAGYSCAKRPFNFVEGDTQLTLNEYLFGEPVDLPFSFPFYDQFYDTMFISSDGFISFGSYTYSFMNEEIPTSSTPNTAIYPFWDNLVVDDLASIWTAVLGEAPYQQFVVEWRNVRFFGEADKRLDFELILQPNGTILMQYQNLSEDSPVRGQSATIGIENETGEIAFAYGYNTAVLQTPTDAFAFYPPRRGVLQGHITNLNTGLPVANAQIELVTESETRSGFSGENGFYQFLLPEGVYTLNVSVANHGPESATVTVQTDQIVQHDFQLGAAHLTITPSQFAQTVSPNEVITDALILENSGQLPLTYTVQNIERTNADNPRPPDGTFSPDGILDNETVPPEKFEDDATVLVLMDEYPWRSQRLITLLESYDVSFDLAHSTRMETLNLNQYEVIFMANAQPDEFYSRFEANNGRFQQYLETGGVLWFGAVARYFSSLTGVTLPQNVVIYSTSMTTLNTVTAPDHPVMAGVPNPFGEMASRSYFFDLPENAQILAAQPGTHLPTLIEYPVGLGRVLASGQPLEYAYEYGEMDTAMILENSLAYLLNLPPLPSADWLRLEATSGTVAPGTTESLQLVLDSRGLRPGTYQASLVVRSNAPNLADTEVPITFVVSGASLNINVGGGAYTDVLGEVWLADQAHEPGSWGYVNLSSNATRSNRPIAESDDDLLYQTMRVDPYGYRFDGLAPGYYQIDLHFAEVRLNQPGARLFDVIVEEELVLPAHDIFYEVGANTAEVRSVWVEVPENGRLDIRLISRRGYNRAVLSALRLIQLPANWSGND